MDDAPIVETIGVGSVMKLVLLAGGCERIMGRRVNPAGEGERDERCPDHLLVRVVAQDGPRRNEALGQCVAAGM
jgi:hypothetical protein